jgi:hypothetical protein
MIMFKEFYNPGEEADITKESVPQQELRGAIASLQHALQDETQPLEQRITWANSLVELLTTKAQAHPDNKLMKIDLAEAQTYRDELKRDAANDSLAVDDRKAA